MTIDLLKLQKTKKKNTIGAMNILLYGLPKVGKSTFASEIPNALFLSTEDGLNFLEVHNVRINSWMDVYEVAKSLVEQKHGFKTLIIDTVDLFYKHCEFHIMKKHQIEHPSDLAFGKGFTLVKNEFLRVVLGLNSLGLGMFFISHAKEREMKKKGSSWTYMSTTMSGSAETMICGMVDLILYSYITDDNKRILRTKPTRYINAGDRSGRLPELIEMNYKHLESELSEKAKEQTK